VGRRLRGLIVVLWRAGLHICEALALAEADLDARRGSLLVRRGKGGRRREVGMDDWAWEQLEPWLKARAELPIGPLFCAWSTVRPVDGHGLPPRRALTCGMWRARPACGGGLRRTSCGMPMPLRSRARACR
jgi:integrase